MTPEEANPRVHHATVKGARTSLAHRGISQESYAAVLRGEISLQRARELGRERGPTTDTPTPSGGRGRASEGPPKGREPRPCLCGCGQHPRSPRSRFVQGHDARLHGELKRNLEKDPLLKNEKFSNEQRRYAVERGLVGPEVLREGHDG